LLEIGCGTGAVLSALEQDLEASGAQLALSGIQTHGLDLEPAYLDLAQDNAPSVQLTCGDAHTLPYAADSFSAVFCHFLLLWVNDPREVLVEAYRVARPSGVVLCLAEPDYGGRVDYPLELAPLGKWQQESLKQQGADPLIGRRLRALYQEAGFSDVEAGVLGGQWQDQSSEQEQQGEWQMLVHDLGDHIPSQTLERLKTVDAAARARGERILYIPTFWAWGRK
jgi:ubiquinone/menaquinone biosynthesis C-methylase UbiE